MGMPLASTIGQMPVSVGQSRQVIPALGDVMVTLYNQDVTNVVWVSRNPSFVPNSLSAVPIQPLTSAPFNASRPLYAVAAVPVTALAILPEGGNLAPSPVQIAQNIALSGVPLLTASTPLAQAASVVIAAGGSVTIPASSVFSVSQIGFEAVFRVRYNVANGANAGYGMTFSWSDSASGLLVDTDTMVSAIAAFNDATNFATRIKGTSKANQLVVTITNLDTVQPINLTYAILENSRVYPYDLDITWVGGRPSSIPGIALPTVLLPDSHTMLIHIDAALANGSFDTFIAPPHLGPMYINMWESGVSAANIQIKLKMWPDSFYGGVGNIVYLINDVLQSGNPDKYTATFFQGGGPLAITITNAGSVAANYNLIVTAGSQ